MAAALSLAISDYVLRALLLFAATRNPLHVLFCWQWTVVHVGLLYLFRSTLSKRPLLTATWLNGLFAAFFILPWALGIMLHHQTLMFDNVTFWERGRILMPGWLYIGRELAANLMANVIVLIVAMAIARRTRAR